MSVCVNRAIFFAGVGRDGLFDATATASSTGELLIRCSVRGLKLRGSTFDGADGVDSNDL